VGTPSADADARVRVSREDLDKREVARRARDQDVMPERMQHLRPIDEVTMVEAAFTREASERHLHQNYRLPAEVGFPKKPLARALEQRERHLRGRPEGSPFDEEWTLVENEHTVTAKVLTEHSAAGLEERRHR
jgi:hypothetical protein